MLEVEGVKKSFTGFKLGPISFRLEQGQHLVLLGPSGSGKSLILELISGFQRADEGKIRLNSLDISKKAVQDRSMAFIFQHAALFPHMRVDQNIAYPLRSRGLSRKSIRQQLNELARRTQVSHLLARQPASLSGGEVQRVSIARALATQPKLLLLDEPLSALDVQMRAQLRDLLRELKNDGLSMLHVTHDFEEAVRLADQVGIMQDGKLIQSDTTDNVFRNPASGFVAHLTGQRNYFKATMEGKAGSQLRVAKTHGLEIKLYSHSAGGKGLLLINEDQITLLTAAPDSSAQNVFRGKVQAVNKMPVGSEVIVDVGIPIFVKLSDESVLALQLHPGKAIYASFKAGAVRFLSL